MQLMDIIIIIILLYAHPHIRQQVKTNPVQDAHQMKYSQYNQVSSV
jgi:ABC-type uncharacterized transport system substrate-binding protein